MRSAHWTDCTLHKLKRHRLHSLEDYTKYRLYTLLVVLYRVRDWGGMFTIFVGFFISGIGTSFYYSFGVPYLDDNVSKENSPFLLGK